MLCYNALRSALWPLLLLACFTYSSVHASTLHPLLAHHHLCYVDVYCICRPTMCFVDNLPLCFKQSATKEITLTKAILYVDVNSRFLRIVGLRYEQFNFVLYKNGLMILSISSVT